MTDRHTGHCLEFHMVHNPATRTVQLSMVAGIGDGRVVRYEGEGTYHRSGPRVELNMQSEPVEFDLGDAFRNYIPGLPTATASCVVGELYFTKPVTQVLLPEVTDD